jgi:hypothetical protein
LRRQTVHQKGHACPLVVKICVQVHLRLTKVEIITIGKMLICIHFCCSIKTW